MKHSPRIAIIGAGPGGLTLARILHRHSIAASVFEGEAFSSARSQGGSLDLHAESGQFALRCAGLSDEFARIARYEDQESRVYDKHGTLRLVDTEVSGKDRPEVDRGHLRQILLDSLPPEIIHWGCALSRVEPQDNETFTLVFRNNVRQNFDLVVGADGAWSRVRPLVSAARPRYSGVTFVEVGIDEADTRCPEIARLVGRGLMFALGDNKAIIGHRDANAHIGAYVALRVSEDWIETGGLNQSSPDALRDSLAACFHDWSDDLRQIIYRSGDKMTPRKIYALPVGHRWEPRTGITLLGDAAHLMSPFTGEGVNLALWDAAYLALALRENDWPTAVRGYETAMFARAEKTAQGAEAGIITAFSDDGLSQMLQQMESQRSV